MVNKGNRDNEALIEWLETEMRRLEDSHSE
jgi:hypothetical protein